MDFLPPIREMYVNGITFHWLSLELIMRFIHITLWAANIELKSGNFMKVVYQSSIFDFWAIIPKEIT